MIGALMIGLVGSLHCIGMCGPLAISLSSPVGSSRLKFLNPFLYNVGRIVTYSLMGTGVALLGEPLRMAGWQQALSIFGGLVMLLAALGYFLPMYLTKATNPVTESILRARNSACIWRSAVR
jgi:uncharacterized protein